MMMSISRAAGMQLKRIWSTWLSGLSISDESTGVGEMTSHSLSHQIHPPRCSSNELRLMIKALFKLLS